MSTLRLFLDDSSLPLNALSEVEWRVLDGHTVGHGRGLLADLPAARRLEVFLPPALALRCVVSLPPGARRQARKLLPHALDPVLLGDASAQHLAFTMQGDQCQVTAVERGVMETLMATLAERKLRPQAIYVADALIAPDGQSLLWYGNGWARRLPDAAQWFDTASPATCPALLQQVLAGAEHLQLAVPAAASAQVELARWREACGIDVLLGQGDPLAHAVAPDALNLLQGEFAAGPQLDIDFQRLKPAASLLAACLAMLLLAWISQWLAWRSEEKALTHSMESAYATAFPGEVAIDSKLLPERLARKRASHATNAAGDAVGGLAAVAEHLRAPSGTRLLTLDMKGNHIEAEYQAKPEQIAPLLGELNQLGKAESHPSGPDHVSISLTLNS